MTAPSPTQLRNDLNLIAQTVEKAKIDGSVKKLLHEILDWNVGVADAYAELTERADLADGAIGDLVEDAQAEGLSPETAQVLLVAYEQSRNINQTFRTLLEGEGNPLPEITTHQVLALLKNSDQQISAAVALVQDLTVEEDEDEETTAGGESDEDESDESDESEEDEEADVVTMPANGTDQAPRATKES